MFDIREKKLEKGQIIPLTYDYVFTGIFNNEENIIILENFLALYFNKDLKDIKGKVKIKSRDLSIDSKKEKNKQIDLIVDLDGKKINVELSNGGGTSIVDRNVVFASKIHSGQLKYKDNKYQNIKKTIQINLNNYSCNKHRLVERYYLMNEDKEILTEKLEIDIVDLVKAKEKIYNESEERLARFCRALMSDTEEELIKEVEGIMEKEAKEKLVEEVNKYSSDDEVVALYSAYSREELERNTLIEDVRLLKEEKKELKEENKKIAKDSKLEIAKKMLDKNLDIATISEITGLTEKEIKNL